MESVGDGVAPELLGTRAFCYRPHQTYHVLRPEELIRVGDLPDERAVFLANTTTAFNGVLDATLHYGDVVVVFGQGVIGQFVGRLCKAGGCTVMVVDPLESPDHAAATFVGLSPYGQFFADGVFWASLGRSCIWTVGTLVVVSWSYAADIGMAMFAILAVTLAVYFRVAQPTKEGMAMQRRGVLLDVAWYVGMGLFLLLFLSPIIWVYLASLTPSTLLAASPMAIFDVTHYSFAAFPRVWAGSGYGCDPAGAGRSGAGRWGGASSMCCATSSSPWPS